MTTDSIREAGPYKLARLAECSDPDDFDSGGARWIEQVRDDAVERWDFWNASEHERGEGPEDAAHEIADSAVPVYTHDRWIVFVDLAAYQQDIEDLAGSSGEVDMTALAGVALYVIAERLVLAVFEALDAESDGTSGQDRESYTDTQDRDNYTDGGE